MPNTGGYDIVLQFQQEVLLDLLSRVLDDPLTNNTKAERFLPKQFTLPEPPQEPVVKIWWEEPEIAIEESGDAEALGVAVPMHGGVRLEQSGRIFTVEGAVTVSRGVRVSSDTMGTPYLVLDEPTLESLRLRHLKLSYAGSPLLAPDDAAQVSSHVAPIALLLLKTLARLPLSYAIGSFLPRLPAAAEAQRPANASAAAPPYAFPASAVGVHVLREKPIVGVALGISLNGGAHDPTAITSAFPQSAPPDLLQRVLPDVLRHAQPNTTLTLSTTGMNTILMQLNTLGALEGSVESGARGARETRWRWEALAVHFQEGNIALAGTFTTNTGNNGNNGNTSADTRPIVANLRCLIDERKRLIIEPLAVAAGPDRAPADAATAALVAASWKAIFLRLLRVEPINGRRRDGYEPDALVQRFSVPTTQIGFDIPASALLLTEGALTLVYDLPQNKERLVAEVLDRL